MEPTTNQLTAKSKSHTNVDFSNTEIAFSNKSDKELKKMARLFRLMANNAIVSVGSHMGLLAMKLRLPFVETIIKKTIFNHFCGGQTLEDSQKTIDHLYKFNALTVLDYGAEAKSTEEDFNNVCNELVKAIEFAAKNESIPVVSTKLSGLADNDLLEKVQSDNPLTASEEIDYQKFKKRVDSICRRAAELDVCVFIDAEESWIQITIDDLVFELMEKYNTKKVIVYNTYQLYRHDKLQQMIDDHKTALQKGYWFGAKLVRGAYMEKERERAEQGGYPSPIHVDQDATNKDFNLGIKYCVDNYESIASCCASHNAESNLYQAELITEKGIKRDHPHLNFSQLMGMSDSITFNLSEAGYNVSKYVVYGPIKEVIPYLIRRAQENSSVTGEMGRELAEVMIEMKRRKL